MSNEFPSLSFEGDFRIPPIPVLLLQQLLLLRQNIYKNTKYVQLKRSSLKRFFQASDLKRLSSSVSQVDPFCANRGILLVSVSSQSRLLNLEREGGNIKKGTIRSLRSFDISWP